MPSDPTRPLEPESTDPAPDPAPAPTPPAAWYAEREAGAREREEALEGRMRTIAGWRLLAFLGVVAPLLALETSPRELRPVLVGVAAVVAVAFVVLVVRHRSLRRLRDREHLRGVVSREGLARLERRWDSLPLLPFPPHPDHHPYAADLDVTGRASLAHLLGTPRTIPGRERLRSALLDPLAGDPAEGRALREERRASVAVLARHPELLEQVQVAARGVERPADPEGLARFRAWATGPGWSPRGGMGAWLLGARVLTAANLVLFAGWFAGWPPAWLGGAALSFLLWSRVRGEAHRRFDAVTDAEASLGRWSELLEAATGLPTDTPLLERLREGAYAPVEGARALRALTRISDWAELRRSSLVYFPLAFLALWDVHPLVPMERWRARYGDRVDRWLESVGELEYLVALALLRHDHPDWVLPSERKADREAGREAEPGSDATPPSIRARNLRHPLLPPNRAVGNDLDLPAPGTLLLVTGSNMSGKSTLLRSLGTNQLLFLAGGPVAADAWSSPPVLPWTSMRVSDSLSEGVSFFMAELQRLRRVVDAARAAPVLVLLDEILQGTNTAERRTAARIILEHLLAAGAVGAVSTHDLTLADAPTLAPHLVQVHLKEEVREVEGRRLLHFDYRLRPGPATSRNALILLELVGLGEEDSGDAERADP